MPDSVHLAVAQFSAEIRNPARNLDAIERLSIKASKDGTQFILLPEDCITGYPAEANSAFNVALRESADEFHRLQQIATQTKITIAAGFIERLAEHCHSAHYIANPDGSHTLIRKYSIDTRDQKIGITPAAPQHDDLTIDGIKSAMAICMDGTDDFFAAANRNGAKIILHPSGGACAVSAHATDANAEQIDAAERKGDDQCVAAARDRAKHFNAVYLVANPVGFDGQRGYPGNSFIISPTGELLAHLPGTAIIEKMSDAVAVAKVELPTPRAQ